MRNTLGGWLEAEDRLRSYMLVFRRFTDLKGRSSRSEYWWFAVINFLILVVLSNVELQLGLSKLGQPFGIFTGLYAAVALMPSIAVSVRRLHDTTLSGWWVLLAFLPVLGSLILFVLYLRAGTPGPNVYGPDPKAVEPRTFDGVPVARQKGGLTLCPWCDGANPHGLTACQWCHKPYSE